MRLFFIFEFPSEDMFLDEFPTELYSFKHFIRHF